MGQLAIGGKSFGVMIDPEAPVCPDGSPAAEKPALTGSEGLLSRLLDPRGPLSSLSHPPVERTGRAAKARPSWRSWMLPTGRFDSSRRILQLDRTETAMAGEPVRLGCCPEARGVDYDWR